MAKPKHKKKSKHNKKPHTGAERSQVVAEAMNGGGANWTRQTIIAELLTDAHPGSGSGGGGIDALIARDRLGRPVIWASHIEGVLRDAARRLYGPEVAGDFFGRVGGQQQRALFTSLYTKAYPGSRIWRSTARQAIDNRAPKDDTLRVVEHVPKGTKFAGQVELIASDLLLLRRLLKEVDALGGGRATGAFPAHWDPKLRIPRGQVVAAASIVSPKY